MSELLTPDSFPLPMELGWLRDFEEGRAWIEALPALLHGCAEQWSLRLGTPFTGGCTSLALAVTLADGGAAVLKIQFPGRESEHEALALSCWEGNGAIRLLSHDAGRRSLLLERCLPGTPLSRCGRDEALDALDCAAATTVEAGRCAVYAACARGRALGGRRRGGMNVEGVQLADSSPCRLTSSSNRSSTTPTRQFAAQTRHITLA